MQADKSAVYTGRFSTRTKIADRIEKSAAEFHFIDGARFKSSY